MNWSVFPSTHYVLMPRGSFGIAGFSYGRVYKTDHGEFVEPKSSGLLQWSQVQMETLRHQYNATGFKVSDFEAEKGIATYVHAHVIFSLKEQAGQSVWRYGIVTAFDGPAMTLTVLLTIGGDDVLIPFRNARHVDMVAYVLRPFDGVSTNGYPVDDVIKRVAKVSAAYRESLNIEAAAKVANEELTRMDPKSATPRKLHEKEVVLLNHDAGTFHTHWYDAALLWVAKAENHAQAALMVAADPNAPPSEPARSLDTPSSKPAQGTPPSEPARSLDTPPSEPAQGTPPSEPARSLDTPPSKPAQGTPPSEPARSQDTPPSEPARSLDTPPSKPARYLDTPPSEPASTPGDDVPAPDAGNAAEAAFIKWQIEDIKARIQMCSETARSHVQAPLVVPPTNSAYWDICGALPSNLAPASYATATLECLAHVMPFLDSIYAVRNHAFAISLAALLVDIRGDNVGKFGIKHLVLGTHRGEPQEPMAYFTWLMAKIFSTAVPERIFGNKEHWGKPMLAPTHDVLVWEVNVGDELTTTLHDGAYHLTAFVVREGEVRPQYIALVQDVNAWLCLRDGFAKFVTTATPTLENQRACLAFYTRDGRSAPSLPTPERRTSCVSSEFDDYDYDMLSDEWTPDEANSISSPANDPVTPTRVPSTEHKIRTRLLNLELRMVAQAAGKPQKRDSFDESLRLDRRWIAMVKWSVFSMTKDPSRCDEILSELAPALEIPEGVDAFKAVMIIAEHEDLRRLLALCGKTIMGDTLVGGKAGGGRSRGPIFKERRRLRISSAVLQDPAPEDYNNKLKRAQKAWFSNEPTTMVQPFIIDLIWSGLPKALVPWFRRVEEKDFHPHQKDRSKKDGMSTSDDTTPGDVTTLYVYVVDEFVCDAVFLLCKESCVWLELKLPQDNNLLAALKPRMLLGINLMLAFYPQVKPKYMDEARANLDKTMYEYLNEIKAFVEAIPTTTPVDNTATEQYNTIMKASGRFQNCADMTWYGREDGRTFYAAKTLDYALIYKKCSVSGCRTEGRVSGLRRCCTHSCATCTEAGCEKVAITKDRLCNVHFDQKKSRRPAEK